MSMFLLKTLLKKRAEKIKEIATTNPNLNVCTDVVDNNESVVGEVCGPSEAWCYTPKVKYEIPRETKIKWICLSICGGSCLFIILLILFSPLMGGEGEEISTFTSTFMIILLVGVCIISVITGNAIYTYFAKVKTCISTSNNNKSFSDKITKPIYNSDPFILDVMGGKYSNINYQEKQK